MTNSAAGLARQAARDFARYRGRGPAAIPNFGPPRGKVRSPGGTYLYEQVGLGQAPLAVTPGDLPGGVFLRGFSAFAANWVVTFMTLELLQESSGAQSWTRKKRMQASLLIGSALVFVNNFLLPYASGGKGPI